MKLTKFSDYAFRVLIYLGASEKQCCIDEIQKVYGLSRNHLVKVVHHLSCTGYIKSKRGKGGGLRLSKHPSKINIAEVIKKTEPDLNVVECFDPGKNQCCLISACRLKACFIKARKAFLDTLSEFTLEDIIQNKKELLSAFCT